MVEVQEYLGDVYLGTRNVRGLGEVPGDLVADVVESLVYSAVYLRIVRLRGREPPSPLGRR